MTYRALIIEDDADARANLEDILQLDGFDVVMAAMHSRPSTDCWMGRSRPVGRS